MPGHVIRLSLTRDCCRVVSSSLVFSRTASMMGLFDDDGSGGNWRAYANGRARPLSGERLQTSTPNVGGGRGSGERMPSIFTGGATGGATGGGIGRAAGAIPRASEFRSGNRHSRGTRSQGRSSDRLWLRAGGVLRRRP